MSLLPYGRPGTSTDPETSRLSGEILMNLSSWEEEFGTERLELAKVVMVTLLHHIDRQHGLADYMRFCAEVGANLSRQAIEFDALLEQREKEEAG